MSVSPMCNTPVSRKVLRVTVMLLATLAIAVPAVLHFWPKAEPLDVPRSELVLKEGQLYRINQSEPFSGVMVERYPNAALKSRSQIRAGRLDGLSEGWNEKGQLEIRERFVQGVSHGLRIKWYASGAKLSEAMIEKGKLNGPFTRWHENGQIAEQIQMREGEPDGPSIAYHPDGSIKAKATLKMGKVTAQQFWKEGELVASKSTTVSN
jgi:antitoxin component YwqK of YwqJK toxin-antitoxin module